VPSQLPKICPLPSGDLDPHIIHGSLDAPDPPPKWHLNQVSYFVRIQSLLTKRWTNLQNEWGTHLVLIAALLANAVMQLITTTIIIIVIIIKTEAFIRHAFQ